MLAKDIDLAFTPLNVLLSSSTPSASRFFFLYRIRAKLFYPFNIFYNCITTHYITYAIKSALIVFCALSMQMQIDYIIIRTAQYTHFTQQKVRKVNSVHLFHGNLNPFVNSFSLDLLLYKAATFLFNLTREHKRLVCALSALASF